MTWKSLVLRSCIFPLDETDPEIIKNYRMASSLDFKIKNNKQMLGSEVEWKNRISIINL